MAKNKISGTYVVYSDIQGNFDCLEKFSKIIKNMKKKGVICLGDIVDNFSQYSDNRCIGLVRNITDFCIKGNHEEKLNGTAKKKITPCNIRFIKDLPTRLNLGNVLMVHSNMDGEKQRPDSLEKIKKQAEIIKNHYSDIMFVLFGHTHQKGAYTFSKDQLHSLEGDEVKLDKAELNLVNPGGIGLSYGLEKTFVLIDFDTGSLKFYTLEQAEEMAKKADIVNTFDKRWMPSLNNDSYDWFVQYVNTDIPALRSDDEQISKLVERLRKFDKSQVDNMSVAKRKKYLEAYSLSLAQDIASIREKIKGTHYTTDPLKSRTDFLNLKRKKY